MVHETAALDGPARVQGLLKRVEHEAGVRRPAHPPADDAPGIRGRQEISESRRWPPSTSPVPIFTASGTTRSSPATVQRQRLIPDKPLALTTPSPTRRVSRWPTWTKRARLHTKQFRG